MLTGYNTDIRHGELVLHVQTEDKGRDNPAIESVIYMRGQVLAAKRTPYRQLIEEGKGEREIATLMEQQHRTILAAIRAGRFDAKIDAALGPVREPGGGNGQVAGPAAGDDSKTPGRIPETTLPGSVGPADDRREPARETTLKSAALADEQGPTLDQVILEYLETEAEQEHLVLVLDGPERIATGEINRLVLRAISSKAEAPLAGVRVSVRMLSTVADPRTLAVAETDGSGAIELEVEIPAVPGGSAALIISGTSELGRAEIKQLL
ncbi:MAG TPA: hypothetical protein VLA66_05375 [Thermoanaerobaculia bacterium]|nr:hypothetical protein [Thermoanaerobaculia bacterium]